MTNLNERNAQHWILRMAGTLLLARNICARVKVVVTQVCNDSCQGDYLRGEVFRYQSFSYPILVLTRGLENLTFPSLYGNPFWRTLSRKHSESSVITWQAEMAGLRLIGHLNLNIPGLTKPGSESQFSEKSNETCIFCFCFRIKSLWRSVLVVVPLQINDAILILW